MFFGLCGCRVMCIEQVVSARYIESESLVVDCLFRIFLVEAVVVLVV